LSVGDAAVLLVVDELITTFGGALAPPSTSTCGTPPCERRQPPMLASHA